MRKAVVVGLGSMGKRRIRLIRDFFPDIEVCGVDSRDDRLAETGKKSGIPTFDSLDKAISFFKPDTGLVCTSPLSHAAIVSAMLDARLDVFSEIDLISDGIADNAAKAAANGNTLFFSSTPLYRSETQHITTLAADSSAALRYRYHIGQYLPDWHPWEKVGDFFVSDKRTNGCREIIVIELPWLVRTFGKIVDVKSEPSTISTLNLGYPDSYFITLKHESGAVVQLAVDVVSRYANRDMELYSEDLWLHWGGTPKSLEVYDFTNKQMNSVATYDNAIHDERYSSNIVENAYVEELRDFFDTADGKKSADYRAEQNLETLRITDLIEGY